MNENLQNSLNSVVQLMIQQPENLDKRRVHLGLKTLRIYRAHSLGNSFREIDQSLNKLYIDAISDLMGGGVLLTSQVIGLSVLNHQLSRFMISADERIPTYVGEIICSISLRQPDLEQDQINSAIYYLLFEISKISSKF